MAAEKAWRQKTIGRPKTNDRSYWRMFVKKPAVQWIAAVGFFKSSGHRSAFKGSAVKSRKTEAQDQQGLPGSAGSG